MNKLILFLSVCFLIGTQLHAQSKAKFSNKVCTVQKTQLPTNFVEPDRRTYDVLVKGRYAEGVQSDGRRVHGWARDTVNPNLKGVVSIYGYDWHPLKILTKKKTKKDKEGKVVDSWTEYAYTSGIEGKGSLYLYGVENEFVYQKQDAPKSKAEQKREAAAAEKQEALAQNAFLSEEDIAAAEDQPESDIGEDSGLEGELLELVQVIKLDIAEEVETKYYRSRKAAYDAYVKTHRPKLKEFRMNFPEQVYRNAMREMNLAYGYAPVKKRFHLKQMKGDKHPDAKMWNDACVATQMLLGQLRYNQPIAAKQAKFDPIVAYFQEQLDGISDKDRKEKKLKKAAFLNLSNLYFYLDRYDDMVALAQANQDSKMVEKLAKRTLNRADRQRALLAFHGLESCHIATTEEIAEEEIETDDELAADGEEKADGAK